MLYFRLDNPIVFRQIRTAYGCIHVLLPYSLTTPVMLSFESLSEKYLAQHRGSQPLAVAHNALIRDNVRTAMDGRNIIFNGQANARMACVRSSGIVNSEKLSFVSHNIKRVVKNL